MRVKKYLIIQAEYLSTGTTAHDLANLVGKYTGAISLYNSTRKTKWKILAKQSEDELQFFVNNKKFKGKRHG